LGLQHCTVIIAVGAVPVAAMVEGYSQFPDIRYVAVGGDSKGKPFIMIDGHPPDNIRSTIKDIVARST
jgi:hypothetical protein